MDQTSSQNMQNSSSIFDNFTHRARNAVKHAKKLASSLAHESLEPIHLLYGVLHTINRQHMHCLKTHSITIELVTYFTKSITEFTKSSKDTLPHLSQSVLNVFLKARELASTLGYKYVSSEQLMLSLTEISDKFMSQLFEQNNVNIEALKSEVLQAINAIKNETTYSPGIPSDIQDLNVSSDQYDMPSSATVTKKSTLKEKIELLKSCGKDLTELAQQGKLEKVTGREEELANVIKILLRMKKNNPMLKGEPGVGKTTIAEGLAQAIANGEVTDGLANKHVISLEMSSMVAGTKYRGQFEEKLKAIIEAAQDPNIILVIDEIHTIVGAGSAEGAIDAGNILKPALARGLKCIGATTFEEYKAIEKDAALARRFSPVIIREPSEKETISILHGLKKKLEVHHNCKYSDEAINLIPKLTNRYMPDRFLPDKAVDIMDEAGALVRMQNYNTKSALISIKADLKQASFKKLEAIEMQNYSLAVEFRTKEHSIKQQISKMQNLAKNEQNSTKKVGIQTIAKVISEHTGIPHTNITSTETQKLTKLKTMLSNMVFGQDDAIEKVCNSLIQAKLGLKDPARPSSFLFLGPTGVGKTHLSINITSMYADRSDSLIKVDMSEYMEKFSVSRILGSPPGYVGHDDSKTLSDRVRKNPYSVVLFDEIEKAHPDVLDLMLQILENGLLTDSTGRKIDFSHSLVILTSNIGSSHFTDSHLGFATIPSDQKNSALHHERITEQVIAVTAKKLRPELMNRFDSIVVFKPLTKQYMNSITNIEVQKIQKRLKEQFKKTIHINKDVIDHISSKGFDPKYGARSIRRVVQNELTNAISQFIISNSSKLKALKATILDNKIHISCEISNNQIANTLQETKI